MSKRKSLSASLRWSIFARDGFTCRYCGRQAGQDGVTLAVDHVVSVAEGGDNRIGNLVTACQSCNGGKSARSLTSAPTSDDVGNRIEQQSLTAMARIESIKAQERAMALTIEAERDAYQAIVNIKGMAYGLDTVTIQKHEIKTAQNIAAEFGADVLAQWYAAANRNQCPEHLAIKYVCGAARNARECQ